MSNSVPVAGEQWLRAHNRGPGLPQLLMWLLEWLAVHSQLCGLLLQSTTGGAGVACDRTPEKIRLPNILASLHQRLGR
jgi:hypothetical protein